MTIARLIEGRTAPIQTCDVGIRVRDAISILAEKRIGAMPVIQNGQVAGIFSERDVVYQLHAHGSDVLDKPVGEVMTSPAVTVDLQSDVLAALGLITRRRIRHLPVMDNDTMVGFISIGDLVKFRLDHVQAEAETLRSYIQSA